MGKDMGGMMRRLVVLSLAIGLISTAIVAAPRLATAAPGPCGSIEIVQLRTLHVVAKIPKKVYKVGETALFKLTVTRPAHEDPLGQGVPIDPPTTQPAEGISIGVGLIVDDVYLWGLGITDQGGKATIRIKLKSYTPAGMAQARAFGKKNLVDTPCLVIDEIGFLPMPNAFEVTK